MDDKRIDEAARCYAEENSMSIEDQMGDVYDGIEELSDAYKSGAKWAINELLKDLWHPANKIPKKFNHYGFAALYILQYNHQIRMVLYDKDNMSWKNVISNSEYWLYVDDLLPKKGGAQ